MASAADRLRDEGRREGRREGKLETGRSILRMLLTRRFGTLPPDVEASIAAASERELEVWTARVLDAPSLQAVLAED